MAENPTEPIEEKITAVGISEKKALSLLSLAMKAGKIVTGEVSCEKALKSGTAFLIIVGSDASVNTREKFENKTFFYKTPFRVFSTIDKLSRQVGKANRAVFAVCDKGFARAIENFLEGNNVEVKNS